MAVGATVGAIRVRFLKTTGRWDVMEVLRHGGQTERSRFSKKAPVPHDAIHLVVESELGMRHAFWGQVQAGVSSDRLRRLVKEGGHPSAARASEPTPAIVELIQAERLVECFEAELWGGSAGPDAFRAVARTACVQSRVPPVETTDMALGEIRGRLRELRETWEQLDTGRWMELEWK